MSSLLTSQSATNWHIVKQLYLQGAKPPLPPEPTSQHPADHFLRQRANSLMNEMEALYSHSLQQLQERVQKSMQQYRQRIEDLEEEVARLRSTVKNMQQRDQQSNWSGIAPHFEADGETAKPASFIHIEEEEEESLLQPETAHKGLEIPNSERTTVKKELGGSSVNIRRLFADESAAGIKHQYSVRPLSTKESAYFQRDQKEELQTLRSLIEQAHGIKISSTAAVLPEVNAAVRDIHVDSSKNSLRHLQNENHELRQRMGSLQNQLRLTQEQLERVRHLLLRGLEEEAGPYAACF